MTSDGSQTTSHLHTSLCYAVAVCPPASSSSPPHLPQFSVHLLHLHTHSFPFTPSNMKSPVITCMSWDCGRTSCRHREKITPMPSQVSRSHVSCHIKCIMQFPVALQLGSKRQRPHETSSLPCFLCCHL